MLASFSILHLLVDDSSLGVHYTLTISLSIGISDSSSLPVFSLGGLALIQLVSVGISNDSPAVSLAAGGIASLPASAASSSVVARAF